jgi:1,4-alpha-glucan branching enzyme
MGSSKKDVGAVIRKDGVSFRVWAPFAKGVGVTGVFNNWSPTPMQPENDGYWSVEIEGALPGQEYKFLLDTDKGQIYRNDPRALRVNTNEGNSVIVDPHFEWGDDGFVMKPHNEQVLYEIHVGTFNRPDPAGCGTFDDIAAKLDYLADLGVTALQLMPLGSMENDHGWGYTPDYIYAIESLYGSPHELRQLVNAAHQRGLAVLVDVVYNHIGPNENDLWQFDGWSQDNKGGIYFYNDWRAQTPWGETRLDYGRPEVRQYVLDNVKMWLRDFHLDGLRLDSTGFLRNVYGRNDDPSTDIPDAWLLLQDINDRARKMNPAALMLAEDFGSNEYITKPHDQGGAGFGAQWEVGLPYALRQALDSPDDAYRNLGQLCGMLEHRYNGDAFQRVVYSDSHDSAANGAARLSEEISPGDPDSLYAQRRSLLAAALVLTMPGIPMLFQGQEFLEGGSFNDWQALEWDRAEKLAGIVTAHRHLIALRKNQHHNTRGLTGQSFTILHLNEENKILAYHRWDQGGEGDDVVVVFNFANRTQKDYIINFPRAGTWTTRFNSDWKGYSPEFKDTEISAVTVEDGTGAITIAPYSILIFSQD